MRYSRWAITTALLSVARANQRQSYVSRSEEHTSELQSQSNLVCRLLLEKKKKQPEEVARGLESSTQPHTGTSKCDPPVTSSDVAWCTVTHVRTRSVADLLLQYRASRIRD